MDDVESQDERHYRWGSFFLHQLLVEMGIALFQLLGHLDLLQWGWERNALRSTQKDWFAFIWHTWMHHTVVAIVLDDAG